MKAQDVLPDGEDFTVVNGHTLRKGSVAAFLATGFAAGEAGLVVAMPEHVVAITAALAARGWVEAVRPAMGALEKERVASRECPLRPDDGGVTGVRARGALRAHDGGLHERHPRPPQRVGGVEHGHQMGGVGRPCMASHTRAGVQGMSMWVTPSGASASTTALTTAGGEPTVADSPMPFAPIGWCGEGVTV